MHPVGDTSTFIREMLHSLTSPRAPQATADEWHCIATWALVGWRTAQGHSRSDGALVETLSDALDFLETDRAHAPLPADTLPPGR